MKQGQRLHAAQSSESSSTDPVLNIVITVTVLNIVITVTVRKSQIKIFTPKNIVRVACKMDKIARKGEKHSK